LTLSRDDDDGDGVQSFAVHMEQSVCRNTPVKNAISGFRKRFEAHFPTRSLRYVAFDIVIKLHFNRTKQRVQTKIASRTERNSES
jgi:hypothetical protein